MNREFISWDSPTLGRRMDLLWFGHAGRPMIWFPTSFGRFFENEDFGLIGAVGDLIEGGAIQIACVDGLDEESFYARGHHPAERLARHDQFDRYVYGEVVPWAREKAGSGWKFATLGASFGAYHAVNFAFRHPDVVDKTIGFSGRYDIHSFLDGWWDDTAYFHCPTAYVPNMNGDWVARLSRMDIALVTGERDNIVDGTKEMIRILRERGIPHRGDIWDAPYGHDWPWWKIQIRSYVP
ncbi:MAG: esterase family protein [Thermoplasmata archaeon]